MLIIFSFESLALTILSLNSCSYPNTHINNESNKIPNVRYDKYLQSDDVLFLFFNEEIVELLQLALQQLYETDLFFGHS